MQWLANHEPGQQESGCKPQRKRVEIASVHVQNVCSGRLLITSRLFWENPLPMSHKNQRVTIHATGLQGASSTPVVSSAAPKFVKPERPPAAAVTSNNKHQPISSSRRSESSEVLEQRHVDDQTANLMEELIMFEDDFYSSCRETTSPAGRRLATNWNRESDFHDEPVSFLSTKELKRVASDAARYFFLLVMAWRGPSVVIFSSFRRRQVARQGLPASQRCVVWEKFVFVNCRKGQDVSYDVKMKQLFSSTKGVMPPSVKAPDFGRLLLFFGCMHITWNKFNPSLRCACHYLSSGSPVHLRSSSSGGGPVMESVQSVLCLLAADFPQLSYCVPLVDLVFLLLLHMPINQAYTCATAVVRRY